MRFQEMSQAELAAALESIQSELATSPSGSRTRTKTLQELELHQVELEMQNRELREAQAQVDESRARYADLFDLAPVGYCTLDRLGIIEEANLTAAAMLGVPRTHLVGRQFVRLVRAEYLSRFRHHLAECMEQRRRVETELLLEAPSGAPTLVQLVSIPAFDAMGEIVGCKSALQDISVFKRSERILRFLVDAGVALGASLDLEGTVATLARLTVPDIADGCFIDLLDQRSGTCQREVAFARMPDGATLQRIREAAPTLASEGPQARVLRSAQPVQAFDQESAVTLGGQGEKACKARSFICMPLAIQGRPLGVLTLLHDGSGRSFALPDVAFLQGVADRAALAIGNAHSYQIAQRAIRARDETLAIVSHDLRTPLNSILLSASIAAKATAATPEVQKPLHTALKAVDHMKRLISDLVDVSSIDAGQLAIELSTQSASALLDDALSLLRPSAELKRVTLSVAAVPDGLTVECDRDRTRQVLANLVSNAIKFTEADGHIEIFAEGQGGWVAFTVKDTGTGMSRARIPKLFERCWRGEETPTGGRGLGLYVARGIVIAQGGSIRAESESGVGSTFTFTLPAGKSPSVELAAPVARESVDAKRPVLIVDDSPDIRELVSMLLEDRGYPVSTAGNGQEALEYLSHAKVLPRAVLLDLEMPVMDGRALIAAVRKDERLRPLRMLILSGHRNLREHANAIGADGYVSKPFTEEDVLAAVG